MDDRNRLKRQEYSRERDRRVPVDPVCHVANMKNERGREDRERDLLPAVDVL